MLTATIIIPAAGQGNRMGQSIPKQLLPLAGLPVIVHTLQRFHELEQVERIVIGTSRDIRDQVAVWIEHYQLHKCHVVVGGDTRQATVKACLQLVPDTTQVVAVHDAVRPFVTEAHIVEVLTQAQTTGTALSAMPAKDTIKQRLKNGKLKTLDRDTIYLAATPQAAQTLLMKAAYAQDMVATDEATLLEALGQKITLVACGYDNIKLTTPEDLFYGEFLMQRQQGSQPQASDPLVSPAPTQSTLAPLTVSPPAETNRAIDTNHVTIYTDGACRGNPGPGGYGVILMKGNHQKELSAGYQHTTNNRMEIMAVVAGLESLKTACQVTVYSDSKYVIDSITKGWVYGWQKRGWLKADKQPAQNADLWQRLLPLLQKHHVSFVWVKGHGDNPHNNRCDELAVAATKHTQLQVDLGFTHEERKV